MANMSGIDACIKKCRCGRLGLCCFSNTYFRETERDEII